ncbi:hypothetical protein IFR05_017154, partial [Cadophora sp. M221]
KQAAKAPPDYDISTLESSTKVSQILKSANLPCAGAQESATLSNQISGNFTDEGSTLTPKDHQLDIVHLTAFSVPLSSAKSDFITPRTSKPASPSIRSQQVHKPQQDRGGRWSSGRGGAKRKAPADGAGAGDSPASAAKRRHLSAGEEREGAEPGSPDEEPTLTNPYGLS